MIDASFKICLVIEHLGCTQHPGRDYRRRDRACAVY